MVVARIERHSKGHATAVIEPTEKLSKVLCFDAKAMNVKSMYYLSVLKPFVVRWSRA
jgi:hypothetical protein